MTISGIEFLRRFSHHVLPFGFVRTRHYGFLASKNKPIELNKAKESLQQPKWEKQNYTWQQIATERLGYDPHCCPHCKQHKIIITQVVHPKRAPPNYMERC